MISYDRHVTNRWLKSTPMKWDTPLSTSYIIISVYFSRRTVFLLEIQHIVLSCCYIACVGDRHPLVKCCSIYIHIYIMQMQDCHAQMSHKTVTLMSANIWLDGLHEEKDSQWNDNKLRQHKGGRNLKIFINRKNVCIGHCSHRFGRHSGKYPIALCLKCALGKSLCQVLFSPSTSPYCFIMYIIKGWIQITSP